MSGYFEADWLALREPADRAARPEALLKKVQHWARSRATLRITDLGSGTGSNPRYLAPRLDARQSWRLLDHDAGLLGQAQTLLNGLRGAGGQPVAVTTETTDLSDPSGLFTDQPHLITASALLDLVSETWLQQLAAACRRANAAVLFALSYDGRMGWQPADDADGQLTRAVNAHQTRDKGLGPALGPAAAARAVEIFEHAGYAVSSLDSPWQIGPDQPALQAALLQGWLGAAVEQEPASQARFRDWAAAHRRHIDQGLAVWSVGHRDLFAIPGRDKPRS